MVRLGLSIPTTILATRRVLATAMPGLGVTAIAIIGRVTVIIAMVITGPVIITVDIAAGATDADR